jgi:hypothetical protein
MAGNAAPLVRFCPSVPLLHTMGGCEDYLLVHLHHRASVTELVANKNGPLPPLGQTKGRLFLSRHVMPLAQTLLHCTLTSWVHQRLHMRIHSCLLSRG